MTTTDTTCLQFLWAEDEIDEATHRHPTKADLLHHSFALLTPTHPLMATEFVHRSHCRDLLDRVAAGTDTRPATAAELCCASCEASQIAPLTRAATGLYFRMWAQAFPHLPHASDLLPHLEAVDGDRIDDLETHHRRTLSIPTRTLGPVECSGLHHGKPTKCRYATDVTA
ncbi:hypothetical protein GCM10022243_17610 [Saccharothrix violaceirubra]|uniref:Uncharacterized protein n=1 Tax=Saccharothrix violaceirubra TaxID=413306 RepID=A0A7W7SYX1_9PSEU|nr:hypothetical protein [Saccharothrix violaceirubra]MBB4963504.1 hypothetical protein [Saccharothrix violaceirubra]